MKEELISILEKLGNIRKDVTINVNGQKLKEDNLDDTISNVIKMRHRVTLSSGKYPYNINIVSPADGTLCYLHYQEYPECCGSVIIYLMKNYVDDNLFPIALKTAFACAKINKYSMASYIVSIEEQNSIYGIVRNDKSLYDNLLEFKNHRTDHTCITFTKLLY